MSEAALPVRPVALAGFIFGIIAFTAVTGILVAIAFVPRWGARTPDLLRFGLIGVGAIGFNTACGVAALRLKERRPDLYGLIEMSVSMLWGLIPAMQIVYGTRARPWTLETLAELSAVYVFVRGATNAQNAPGDRLICRLSRIICGS